MAENNDATILTLLKKELKIYSDKQMKTVLDLLEEGNTVPFIARYRKEMTGSIDQVQIREIEDRYHYLQNLEKRKGEDLRIKENQSKHRLRCN